MERQSLPAQTAEAILAHLGKGAWKQWLPGERQIGEMLRVSRGTVRSALAILQQRQQVAAVASRGYRVTNRRGVGDRGTEELSIGLLSSEPLETKRPYFALMIGQIRELAQARGWKVVPHHGRRYFGSRAETELLRLVRSSRVSCWVLVHSSRRAQQWFAQARIPALVSGHTYEGISLPSVDVDFRAGGRHAGALLARLRHTCVATIVSRQRLPGLVEGESGFAAGFHGATGSRGAVLPVPFDGDHGALVRSLGQVMQRPVRPTAILTETPNQYLTVLSALARLRLAVPDDVSLVCRLDDPFLDHLVPEPTRYRVSPVTFARSLVRMAAHLATGEILPHARRLIIPDFVRGGSLGLACRDKCS